MHFQVLESQGKEERFIDVSIRFNGLTICVGFSAQMSWLVFLFLGWSGLLYYRSTQVAVCGNRTCGSRTLGCMKMSAA